MLHRQIRRRPRLHLAVILGAIAIAVSALIFGHDVQDRLSHGGFDDPSAESSRAENILDDRFGGGEANLVLIADAGRSVDDQEIADAGSALTTTAAGLPGVVWARSYWTAGRPTDLRSTDGTGALVLVRLEGDQDATARLAQAVVPELRLHGAPFQIAAAGSAQVQAEVGEQTEADLLKAELIAAPITLILLVFVFGSAVAALLPLLIAGLSVVTTLAVLRVIASTTSVSVYSVNIVTALGLGLAIDYSLFIVTRYREELAAGAESREAVRTTVRTAGRTVLFSGITVATSLSALLVFPLFFLRSFAYGGVAVVLLAVVEAVVVVPAMLLVLGPRVNALDVLAARRARRTRSHPDRRPVGAHRAPRPGFWSRLAVVVMRHPIAFGSAVVVFLLILGAPFAQAQFGLFDDRALPADAQAHRATDELRTRFDTGGARAVPVVLPGVDADDPGLPDYAAALSRLPGVDRVDTVTGAYAGGGPVAPADPLSARFGDDGSVWLSLASAVEPYSAAAGAQVQAIRDVPAPGRALVGGQAAELVDTKAAIVAKAPLAIAIVVLSMLVLLFLFTGSVLIPIKAVALNVISLSATFGAMVWVFQQGHLSFLVGSPTVTGYLDITIPILMFCVAFGVSMDYEVFLISRIAEEYRRSGDNDRAVVFGLARTGRLITSAAALIAVVLLAFATSGVTLLKLLGLGMAVAVIVDATLVRGILVPAVMRLAGPANWWAPAPLRRLHQRIGLHEGVGPDRPTSAPPGPESPPREPLLPAGGITGPAPTI